MITLSYFRTARSAAPMRVDSCLRSSLMVESVPWQDPPDKFSGNEISRLLRLMNCFRQWIGRDLGM